MGVVKEFNLGATHVRIHDDYCVSAEESKKIMNGLTKYLLQIKKDALPTKVEASQVDKSENLSTTV